ncbi:MAG: hypothetical protein LBJ47_11685 [Tannerella sp.]|jgi:hypothetical protein|nr:hypothetical protein [Tannerella sp.]
MRRNSVFIVICACLCFTTQCDGIDDIEQALSVVTEGTEEVPGYDKFYPSVSAESAAELNERVKCPSPAKTGEEYELAGKWKLTLRINGTDTVDCSCEDVVYHFKPDQTLTVSTGDETEEDVAYEYDWGFPFCPVCLPLNPRPNLRMGSSEVYCWALDKKMLVYPQFEEKYIIVDSYEGPSSMELADIIPLFGIQWIFVRID